MNNQKWQWSKISRDVIFPLAGLVVIYHEVFQSQLDRVSVLTIALGLIFGPAWLRRDEKKKKDTE